MALVDTEAQFALPAVDPEKQAVIDFLADYSVETSPTAAQRTPSFRDLLPAGTRVYVAALPGADFGEVVDAATRLRREGMTPVPHVPARSLPGLAALDDYVGRLAGEAGVDQALCIGGGVARPVGDFDRTIQVLRTGVLDRHGIRTIGVAGHPEGSPDISDAEMRAATAEKNAFAHETDAALYLATQFCFDASAIIAWDKALRLQGNTLPIHIGIAGPAKLKSLLSYAKLCGVGNSMRVLTRQASNLARLTAVSAPDRVVADLARYQAADPHCGIVRAHFYTFGGLARTTGWIGGALDGDFTMRRDGRGFTVDRDFD